MGKAIDDQEVELETPIDNVFVAPSIKTVDILRGASYAYHSSIPSVIQNDMSTECVLGVDEAGRGPVLGPMVYGLFYLPLTSHRSLLADTHHFDDSKVLTPQVRSQLMEKLCDSNSDLFKACGWATKVMSALDISAGMMKPGASYNLNAQAMDATIELIKDVFAAGINVTEIYIDTIGSPLTYQNKLSKIFPTCSITVAKKADSLYPCVSAASVCAKVTRDAALEVCYQAYEGVHTTENVLSTPGWGSGYPSDARCTNWLKSNMDPVFGWGNECRFSWGTAKDLLETDRYGAPVEWPEEDDDETTRMTDFFTSGPMAEHTTNELKHWYGHEVAADIFSLN